MPEGTATAQKNLRPPRGLELSTGYPQVIHKNIHRPKLSTSYPQIYPQGPRLSQKDSEVNECE